MDQDELVVKLQRMEEILARGIQVRVEQRDPEPVVLIKVIDPGDHVLVPEISQLALDLFRESFS